MTAAIDITTEQRRTLLALLHRFIPGVAVWAYGSRVKWTARLNSDLDLVVFAAPGRHRRVSELKDALASSNLPFVVDVHIWDEVPERFHEIIRNEYVVLQDAERDREESGKAGWKIVRIDDIAATDGIAGGPFGSELVRSDYVPVGVPVIRGANLGAEAGGFDATSFVYVSPKKADALARNQAVPGDIVVTQRGTLGQVAIVPRIGFDRFVISQSQMRLRCNLTKAIPQYVYYWLRYPKTIEYIRSNAVAAGVPHINLGFFRAMELPLPPLPQQRAIASILGTLDDKIALNQRTNDTLESIARTLFKSWFVDFDPVRSKARGRTLGGMDVETARLFPDKLGESPLEETPSGWTRAPLNHWVTALSGGTPARDNPSLWGGTLPWISPKVMTEIHADVAEEYVTEKAVGNGTRLAPSGSTMVMVRGMGLHQEVRVSQARRDVTFNQDVKALVPIKIEPSLLLFALLNAQQELLSRVESSGHGTGRLPSDILLTHPITMPAAPVQRALAKTFDGINSRIAVSRKEERTLAAVRDALLPRLLSGELRIPDAERVVEAAT
jgi:type I restriction enzyme S subunit